MPDVTFSFWESEEEADWYDFSVEEYFWATVLPRPHRLFTDRSGESLWYFNLNMTFASISAYRKMGETYTVYKWFRAAQLAPVLLPVAAAAGYVATSDVHGGATGMLVGDMNMGMPVTTQAGSSKKTAQNPAGWDFSSWWSGLW